VYPALAVLQSVAQNKRQPTQVLWVGSQGGMEAELIAREKVPFTTIPAAGVHGVGLRALPGNIYRLLRGFFAARRVLGQFRPDVLFFTGGYVAPPMALAGLRLPQLVFVPDIEPGLALKFLTRLADRVAVSVDASSSYFPPRSPVTVTGYPVRPQLSQVDRSEAYRSFGLSPHLPTLLVTGGSLGALTINKAVVAVLPELLEEMQVIHVTGNFTWDQFKAVRSTLSPAQAERYRPFPYLHAEMGAAYTIADLLISRAGASSLGELPHFGLPAILVPYPHAWRYQKVNADYLAQRGAAVLVPDEQLPTRTLPLVRGLIRDSERRQEMRRAMRSLAQPGAADSIANLLFELGSKDTRGRN
jgi:UDP-N-acetylglucosamine--N-acetylmuramyl-(pentapeptide) pyrophosphoryl-undecaprenol N-acetylglucosamine transferase